MDRTDFDVAQFHCCRDLYGNIHSVALCKRNGRTALCFDPGSASHDDELDNRRYAVKGIFDNLTKVELRTWKRALAARSIGQIAEEENVTRQAIYGRFRGNSKKQGGMIAKNRWVREWWTRRKEFFSDEEVL